VNYQRLYEYRFRGIDQRQREEVWEEIATHVYFELGQPKTVLDPAAGRGEFINNIPAIERWAVDRVAYPEGTHRPGTTVLVADIFDADLPEDHFDGVWVSNFLEHLPTQEAVAEFLEKMNSVLAPGGRIGVMGPNFRFCADKYFDCADHTLALTHVAIAEHLYAAGFEPLKVLPRYLPYSFRGRLLPTRTLTRRYLQTPLAWRLLGKQFLVVGEG
jgi:SAM-dependent methyltransferase